MLPFSSSSSSDAPTATPAEIRIRSLAPGDDSTAFRTLNEEWITRHFTLEAKDREILGDPERSILSKGGRVYLADLGDQTVGCVALIPLDGGVYEVSKMAVAPGLRGQGIGRQMLGHAIAEARTMGAASLFLGSSTKLPAAVRLYESVGFCHVSREHLPQLAYVRADVFMHMPL